MNVEGDDEQENDVVDVSLVTVQVSTQECVSPLSCKKRSNKIREFSGRKGRHKLHVTTETVSSGEGIIASYLTEVLTKQVTRDPNSPSTPSGQETSGKMCDENVEEIKNSNKDKTIRNLERIASPTQRKNCESCTDEVAGSKTGNGRPGTPIHNGEAFIFQDTILYPPSPSTLSEKSEDYNNTKNGVGVEDTKEEVAVTDNDGPTTGEINNINSGGDDAPKNAVDPSTGQSDTDINADTANNANNNKINGNTAPASLSSLSKEQSTSSNKGEERQVQQQEHEVEKEDDNNIDDVDANANANANVTGDNGDVDNDEVEQADADAVAANNNEVETDDAGAVAAGHIDNNNEVEPNDAGAVAANNIDVEQDDDGFGRLLQQVISLEEDESQLVARPRTHGVKRVREKGEALGLGKKVKRLLRRKN